MSEYSGIVRSPSDPSVKTGKRYARIVRATETYPTGGKRCKDTNYPNLWHLRRWAQMPDISYEERDWAGGLVHRRGLLRRRDLARHLVQLRSYDSDADNDWISNERTEAQ